MATETTISRPAPFVEDIGTDLAKQAVALQVFLLYQVDIGSLSQQQVKLQKVLKQDKMLQEHFDVRKQNLAGLAPQVAGQDALQQQAQTLATQGVGSYQPFLQAAQGATGPQAYQQFMSPYQSQVMEASLAEFDRNAQMQQQGLRDQAVASGAFGGGREGVVQSEYMRGSDMNRAQLQAGLLQQGFGQAQQAAQQQFQNQMGLALHYLDYKEQIFQR